MQILIMLGVVAIMAGCAGSNAFRKVLGFRGGLLSFGIMPSTTDGLGASLNIRTVK